MNGSRHRFRLVTANTTMRYVKNTIEIWKMESGESFVSRVSLGPCPHCLGYECIVDTVRLSGTAPEKWPHAVHCGGCGARGPWGDSELGAVQSWNNSTDVCTQHLAPWEPAPVYKDDVSDCRA